MATVSELLEANLFQVFGNRDAGSRRVAIERTYAADVSFTDPEEVVHGWDALEAKAAEILQQAPETFVFAADGRKYVGDAIGAMPWAFGPEGAPILHGVDVITVQDGLIQAVATFFGEGEQP